MRSQRGVYLIELLVALAISGFLAVALAASLSEQMRVTTGTENQLKAAEIAQQVIERFRESSQPLPQYGAIPMQLDSDDGTVVGTIPWLQNRPLSLDYSNLQYPNMTGDLFIGSGPNGRAVVLATLGPGTTSTTSSLTVTVTWSEGVSTRVATFSTTLCKIPPTSPATASPVQPGIHL
jgi:prepilin-type N-terminal cleavage/methylation domain-containing protein